MSRKSGMEPNAPLAKNEDMGAAMEEQSIESLSEALQERAKAALADRALDQDMSLSEADAQRSTPRPRTDNLDERFARRIPADNEVRRRPSSRLKKRLSKQKNQTFSKQPNSRKVLVKRFTNGSAQSRQDLETVNQALADVRGNISGFPKQTQEMVRRLDRTISDYERGNTGIATVYSPVSPPAGMTNDQLAERFRYMAQTDNPSMTFDRYVVADHSLDTAVSNTAPASEGGGPPLVFEYETSRGMYLGGSDTVVDGSQLIARGNSVDVLGVKDVTVERPDGSLYEQRVVQIRDKFDPSLRTTAKS